MTELMHPYADAFRHEGTNGEAVVLCHGFTGNPAQFRPVGKVLNDEGYTVIAPRLAGHGTTQEDMARTDARDWIASLRAGYDAVSDHSRVHLAGISMGGLLSILLARHLPVASVTTVNSPVVVRSLGTYVGSLAARWVPTIEWDEPGPPDLEDEMRPFWISYPGFRTEKLVDLNAIMFGALRAARSVTAPALVIQSKADEAVRPVSGRILAKLLGDDTQVVWLSRTMHNAFIDRERHLITSAMLTRFRSA